MKPNNPLFWTRSIYGKLQLRNLELEESIYRHNIFPAYHNGEIDEPIVIYYEIYDAHGAGYIDDCSYQHSDCRLLPGDYVLDLGGNIGIFSRWASDAGAAKIYTLEPVQENFLLLALNRPDSCEAHRLAISDVDNECVEIAYKVNCPGGSSILKHDNGVLQKVMTITIDTLLKNKIIEKIDFLKMDIEGAEIMAFKGISDENLSNIRCVAMEMHVEAIGQEEANIIYNRMTVLGFNHFTIFNPDKNNMVYFWKK